MESTSTIRLVTAQELLGEPFFITEFSDYDRYGQQFTGLKKLRTQWTPEMAQDLQAYYSIDAEVELTALLEREIQALQYGEWKNEKENNNN